MVMPGRLAPGTVSEGRIPGLDGLRAISIALVIAGHLRSSVTSPPIVQAMLDETWRFDPSNLGVRMFFVISGFLITGLLLRERDEGSGRIDLARFYLRRARRIMPAFYAFLLAMVALSVPGLVVLPVASVVRAATYTSDYLQVVWVVGHTWSLAVEEQFYLIWPLLLAFLSKRTAFACATATLVVSPLARTAAAFGHWPWDVHYSFEGVADALATGCLLAGLRSRLDVCAPYLRMLRSQVCGLWPLAAVALATLNVVGPRLLASAVGVTLLNLTMAVGIDRSTRLPAVGLGRLLNLPVVVMCGMLSYSLYLWQQPILEKGSAILFPWNLIAIGMLATASFVIIERPFRRVGARVETGGTVAHAR
jgi:peptidoglycan/LPS O-acetylase OafA/YrhL